MVQKPEILYSFSLSIIVWLMLIPDKSYGVLLSDIAYISESIKHQNLTNKYSFFLKESEASFKKIKIKYANQWFKVPHKINKHHQVTLQLPFFYNQEILKLYGYKKNNQLWNRRLLLNPHQTPVNSHLGSKIRKIIDLKDFKGNLLFADSIERVSSDFQELKTRENAIYIKAIDKSFNQIYTHFFSKSKDNQIFISNLNKLLLNSNSNKQISRDPISTAFKNLTLYFYDKKALHKYNYAKSKGTTHQLTRYPNTTSNSYSNYFNQSFGCNYKQFNDQTFYSVSLQNFQKNQITPNNLQLKLILKFIQSTSCPYSNSSHNIQDHQIKTISIDLPPPLAKELNNKTLHYFALEKNIKYSITDLRFYALLIKVSRDDRFISREIDDDYVVILNQWFGVDGAFAIANKYYSPRNNISFFPTFEQLLISKN